MQDKFLITIKIKKTIELLEKITLNYPHTENILKNKIIDISYKLLELVYRANIMKDINIMKEIIIEIRLLEYFIKKSLDKKIINYKKYENIGKFLLDINKMVNSWIRYEKDKECV